MTSTRNTARKILSLCTFNVVVLSVICAFFATRVSIGTDKAYEGIEAPPTATHWLYAENLNRFDAGWYQQIALYGYTSERAVFFPLYPLLVRIASWVVPNIVWAASLVSLVATLFAAWFLCAWIEAEFHDQNRAVETAWWLLFFPTGFFLFAPYSESLFIALLSFILWKMGKGSTFTVTIAAILLSLTRLLGVVVAVLFVGDWWRRRHEHGALTQCVTRCIGAISGLVAYMLYLDVHFGDALAFIHSQSQWNRNVLPSFGSVIARWIQYGNEFFLVYQVGNGAPIASRIIDIVFFLGAVVFAIYVARRWRLEYGLWMVAMLVPALVSGTMLSMPRYILPLIFIPASIAVFFSELQKQWLRVVWVSSWTLFVALFSMRYWIA